MTTTFSITKTDWQGVDDKSINDSKNLINSDAVNSQYGLIISIASMLGIRCRIPDNITYIYGKYLTNEEHPVFSNHDQAKVTSPIELKNGETIVFRANGSGICFIALTDSEVSSYTKLVGGYQSANNIYTYTAIEDCYVVLSGVYTFSPVSYIGFEFGIIAGSTDSITSIITRLNQIELKNIVQDSRIETLEASIPHDSNIYTGQTAGNYLVSIDNEYSASIVSYSDAHFTAQIPLIKNKSYVLPFYDIAAYNMAVADGNRNIQSNYVAGKIRGQTFYTRSGMQIVDNTITFICPDDNLYLFINLQLPSFGLDVANSFYLLEGQGSLQEQLDQINLKNEEQDNRLDVLENEGGDTRFLSKTIYVFGDSITWLGGDNCDGTRSGYEHKGWTEYFKERIKPLTMKSYARSGATLCCFSTSSETTSANYGNPHKDNIVWNQIKRMQVDINNGAVQPDYIIIAAGINDAMIINATDPQSSFYDLNQAFQNALTGTAESVLNTDISTTYFGNKTPAQCDSLLKTIRWIKDACISICPNAQIILLTPLQGALAPLEIQKQVSDIIENSSEYLSATVVNQRKSCGISRLQEAKGVHFTYDETHTSVNGAKRVGYTLAEIFKSIVY